MEIKVSVKVLLTVCLFLTIFGCATQQADQSIIEPEPFSAVITDSQWDGEHLPAGQQCHRFGGKNAAAPTMTVAGIPAQANVILIEYSDRTFKLADNGGHGRIGYRITPGTAKLDLPPIPAHTFELPPGFFLVSPHRATKWDTAGAYLPPCSGGRGNSYYIIVKAVIQEDPDIKRFEVLARTTVDLAVY